MRTRATDPKVLTTTSLVDYFRDCVSSALANQHVEAGDETVRYVVQMLADFTRTERLYEHTPEGVMLRPLAELYAEALESPSEEIRLQALRRLGDVALFISGLFADSLNRKLVDIDYYIAMGGGAYGSLAERVRWGAARGRLLAEVFAELSRKFAEFVDVLGEVGEGGSLASARDLMRLYEVWLRTGSRRAARRLARAGVVPAHAAGGRLAH